MFKVIADESNGVQMTTEDYDLPGENRGIWLIVNDDGFPVNSNGEESEGYYWTLHEAAQVVANGLNVKRKLQRKRSKR